MSTREFQDKFRGAGEFEPVASPLYGLRQWGIRGGPPPRLVSTFLRAPWQPGVNTATCLPSLLSVLAGGSPVGHGYDVPKAGCQCGFWAYSPPAGTPTTLQEFGVGSTVVGVIEAWGRVVVGSLGFRAEKARILALAFPPVGTTDPDVATSSTYSVLHRLAPVLAACPCDDDHSDVAPRGHWEGHDPGVQAALAAAYPGAATFPTVEAMLAEFPLTDLAALAGAA